MQMFRRDLSCSSNQTTHCSNFIPLLCGISLQQFAAVCWYRIDRLSPLSPPPHGLCLLCPSLLIFTCVASTLRSVFPAFLSLLFADPLLIPYLPALVPLHSSHASPHLPPSLLTLRGVRGKKAEKIERTCL